MATRTAGRDVPPPLGWGAVDDDESVRAVRRALDVGITLFDIADTYGAGHSERVLGRALAGRRDEAVIATKWGAHVRRGHPAGHRLTGKYGAGSTLPRDDVRGMTLGWREWFRIGRPAPEWLRRLDAVRAALTGDGRTLAQGALGWIWARSGRTVPIPGCRTVAQVEANAAALHTAARREADRPHWPSPMRPTTRP